MSTGYEYQLVAIPGREESEKATEKFQSRAEKYNHKKLSLNERFGIIEKGYFLQAVNFPESKRSIVRLTVPSNPVSKEDFIADIKALEARKAVENERSEEFRDKENITPEQYYSEIKKALSP